MPEHIHGHCWCGGDHSKMGVILHDMKDAEQRLVHDVEHGVHDALLDDSAMVREMHPPGTEAHVRQPWPPEETDS